MTSPPATELAVMKAAATRSAERRRPAERDTRANYCEFSRRGVTLGGEELACLPAVPTGTHRSHDIRLALVKGTVMSAPDPDRPSVSNVSTRRHPLQWASLAVGAAFLLVGVLGFVPGVTTDLDQLTFAGHESDAALLGVFNVSVLHNVVHLLFGVAGIAMARSASGGRAFLLGGGVIYTVLFIYGLVINHDSTANFVPVNAADNWLHLVLAVVMVGLGVLLGHRAETTRAVTDSGGETPGVAT
jgi:hypothetical protein